MANRSASRRSLAVWLYGRHIASLTEPSRYRYRLDFTEEALDVYGEGARVLSLSLPITARAVRESSDQSDHRVSAFLEGLLPEGNLRRQIATAAGVTPIDKMALLSRVGAECAGAVQFLAPGQAPTAGAVRRLSPSEVNRLIADLPTYHLPAGAALQASLAGIQDKVLLVALSDGSWGWPEDGAPSTHVVKPEPIGPGALPHLVDAEDWSLNVARSAGIPAAQSRIEVFDGRRAIIVQRYDRTGVGPDDSPVERIHQEDFGQALGLDPDAKYESTRESETLGSRLSRVARLAADRAVDPQQFRIDLISAVTFNVVTGNGDAHSKNYSLLIGQRGQVSLAPLYDTAPVMHIDPKFKGTGTSSTAAPPSTGSTPTTSWRKRRVGDSEKRRQFARSPPPWIEFTSRSPNRRRTSTGRYAPGSPHCGLANHGRFAQLHRRNPEPERRASASASD